MAPQRFVKVASPQVGEEEAAAVREVLLSGRFVSGPRVAAFEQAFAQYIGVEHAVAVNSGTAALHVSLACLGIQPGDEVIVPALTFFSTVTSVLHQNATPIFADISLDNFCIDPVSFEEMITSRTKAVIPVHYFGHVAEMDTICEIAREHGIAVIEDCAQSHGSLYHGKQTGAIGDFGAFSFFATKHMTTGEGGIITTNNAEWAQTAKLIRSHGLKGRNDHVLLGYNYRMTEMEAAIGMIQLRKLDNLNAARIHNSEKLIAKIKKIPWLTVPQVPAHVRHTYFWCHILVDEEEIGMTTQELIATLREYGIETRNRYVEPLYKQPLLRGRSLITCGLDCPHHNQAPKYEDLYLPNVEKVAGRIIGLPNRPDLSDDEIDYIHDVLSAV